MDLRCHSRWHRCWHQEACGLTSPGIPDSCTKFYLLWPSACRPVSIFTNLDTSQLLFPSALLDRIAGWCETSSHGCDCPLYLHTSCLGTADAGAGEIAAKGSAVESSFTKGGGAGGPKDMVTSEAVEKEGSSCFKGLISKRKEPPPEWPLER
jgi:hypothetical protein